MPVVGHEELDAPSTYLMVKERLLCRRVLQKQAMHRHSNAKKGESPLDVFPACG